MTSSRTTIAGRYLVQEPLGQGGMGRRLHVDNRGFISGPAKAYGMWWSTPESEWTESLGELAVIQRTFRPAE